MASADEDKHQEESRKESPVQQELRCSSERSHVEALLAISDEVFFQQLQPSQALSGCEEAIRGWDRASPKGSVLQGQHRDSKAHLESSNLLSAKSLMDDGNDQTQLSMDTHLCDQEHISVNTHKCSFTSAHAPIRVVSNGLKTLTAEEKKETARTSAHYLPFTRPGKPQKHAQKPNNAVVPIKNFTFLPPIKSPHCTSDQAGSSKKESEEIFHHIFDRKNCVKGLRADANQDPPFYHINHASRKTAGQQTYLFSVPKRYLTSSKPEAAHCSLGKGVATTTAVASARANMHAKCLFS